MLDLDIVTKVTDFDGGVLELDTAAKETEFNGGMLELDNAIACCDFARGVMGLGKILEDDITQLGESDLKKNIEGHVLGEKFTENTHSFNRTPCLKEIGGDHMNHDGLPLDYGLIKEINKAQGNLLRTTIKSP